MKEILEQIKDTIMLLHQMVLSGESTDGTATKMAKQAIKNIDEFLSTEQARSVVEPEVMPNEVIGGGQWLELKDFLPIDIEMVKKKWISVYNIPTGIWKSIETDLDMLNNTCIPNTARLFTLNHLPFCVIKILIDSRREA